MKAMLFLVAVCCLLIASPISAQTNTYSIMLDTSTLTTRPGGPFSVALYLSDGSGVGSGNNTVTLSGFDFGGGNSEGSSTLIGGATGSLSSTVTLTGALFLNSFIQQFAPGSHLAFQASVTHNVYFGSTTGPVCCFDSR